MLPASPPRAAAVEAGGVGPKTRRVGPTGRTSGGSLATPQKLAQEVRDSPHFYISSTLPPTTNVRLIPTYDPTSILHLHGAEKVSPEDCRSGSEHTLVCREHLPADLKCRICSLFGLEETRAREGVGSYEILVPQATMKQIHQSRQCRHQNSEMRAWQ